MGSSSSTISQDVSSVIDALPSRSQDQIYYPRNSDDADKVFSTLRQILPSELVLEIFEFAQYWLQSAAYRDDRTSFGDGNYRDRTPYLTSPPIQGQRLEEIRINIWSHDQGWSSYPEDHGTLRNSWTWFELGIERPEGREGIAKNEDLRLATNVHAQRQAKHHQMMYRRDQNLRWFDALQPGDMISIIPLARFAGWRNIVEKASVEIYASSIV
jgi:hypothetical protein